MAKIQVATGTFTGEKPKGRRHALGMGRGGEFTLCGLAFDFSSEDPSYGIWRDDPCPEPVTCPECIEIARHAAAVLEYVGRKQ